MPGRPEETHLPGADCPDRCDVRTDVTSDPIDVVTRATGSDLTNVMRTPVSGGRSQVSEVPRKGAGQRWATMFFPSTWRGLRPNSNNNEAIDGVALFRAGLTLETYVTGAPNPVKCSASSEEATRWQVKPPLATSDFSPLPKWP